jgi:hypothetical protein
VVSLERGRQLVEDVHDAIQPTWARTAPLWGLIATTEALPAWQPHVGMHEWGDQLMHVYDDTWPSLEKDIWEWRIYVDSTDRVALAGFAERCRMRRRYFAENLQWVAGMADTWGDEPSSQVQARAATRELTMLVHWLTTLEDWLRKRRADLYRARLHLA